MERFIKNSTQAEQQVLENYVSQCSSLHIGVAAWTYLASLTFIVAPIFIVGQSFPTYAVYPFSTNNFYVKILVYAQQSLVGLQTSSAVLLDSFVATLLWFLCARFEMLAMSIDSYNNYKELKVGIKHYQNLLR